MQWKRLFLLLFGVCIVFSKPIDKPVGKGVGFAFSGAGGRIGQHLGLMEALVKGFTPSREKIRPSYLSGASSGALSSVVLNAIFETEDRNLTNGITWESYKQDLFTLKNNDIYDTSVRGLADIFLYNIPHGYILDTANFEKFIRPYAERMNYKTLGDLYLPTAISIVNQSSGFAERLWSNDPRVAHLDLIDVIMASTALPIAFPPRKVKGFGETVWIDGGTGIDTIPVYALLSNPAVTDVYIICYGSALTSGGSGTLPYVLDDIAILRNSLAVINDMRVDLFDGAIDMAADSDVPSFVFIPHLNQTFSALEFEEEQLEYNLSRAWATNNNPLPINKLRSHKIETGRTWRDLLLYITPKL
jgi:predicted acylesterase/phospholipase RssA